MLRDLLHGLIAQTADAQQGGSQMSFFVMMGAIFIAMYFLILRPQAQQQKKQQQLLTQLKKGDEVLLQSGFYAKIFEVREADVTVELAPNVKVKVLKSAITGPAGQPAPTKALETKVEAEKKS